MKLITRFKYFSYLMQLAGLVYLVVLLAIAYQMNVLHDDIESTHINANHSKKLAYDLFQSSEDLTRMARSYVFSGNPVYKKAFFNILNIRNGVTPRPENYSSIYWHLYLDKDTYIEPSKEKPVVSLRSLMLNANFTKLEISLLDESKNESDKLALIEQQAFAIIDNLINNDNINMTTEKRNTALSLLYNVEYMQAKKNIMIPIISVITSLEERIATKVNRSQSQIKYYINVLWVLAVIGLTAVISVGMYIERKFVSPLSRLSKTDELTGILNRRGIEDIAKLEIERYQRTKTGFSLMMIDIDYFKKVNDVYGHAAGDKVLVRVSKIFQNNIRAIDSIARWGGEEFIVILPEIKFDEVHAAAERLRKFIEKNKIRISRKVSINITVSIGLTSFNEDMKNLDDMVLSADNQLYMAKDAGRNKVCVPNEYMAADC